MVFLDPAGTRGSYLVDGGNCVTKGRSSHKECGIKEAGSTMKQAFGDNRGVIRTLSIVSRRIDNRVVLVQEDCVIVGGQGKLRNGWLDLHVKGYKEQLSTTYLEEECLYNNKSLPQARQRCKKGRLIRSSWVKLLGV